MSLYEYLGKAAGKDLGTQVYHAAKRNNIRWAKQEVSNPKYTGDVMTYPESFLKEYFNPSIKSSPLSSIEDESDTPF